MFQEVLRGLITRSSAEREKCSSRSRRTKSHHGLEIAPGRRLAMELCRLMPYREGWWLQNRRYFNPANGYADGMLTAVTSRGVAGGSPSAWLACFFPSAVEDSPMSEGAHLWAVGFDDIK